MRGLLKILAGLVLALAAAVTAFYFWASSPNLPPGRWATTQRAPGVSPGQRPPGQPFVVVSYNVGYFSGMINNLPVTLDEAFLAANLATASAALAKSGPDVVALQEVDFAARRTHDHDQALELAQNLGLAFVAKVVGWDKTYVPYPYWPPSVHFGRMISGQAILGRYPLEDLRRLPLAQRGDTPFYYNALYMDRLAEVVTVDMGRPLIVVNVHLEAFDRPTRERQARQRARLLAELMRKAPLVVMGDFNTAPAWAKVKKGFADEPDQDFTGETTMESMAALGLREAFDQSGPADQAATLSFPSDRPSRKLDHIFYDPARLELVSGRVLVEAGQASDHLPVMAVLRFKN